MSAAYLPVELEEHSNLTFDFTYLDEDDNEVDVTNYGGIILFGIEKDENSLETLFSGDHNDGWVQLGGANGKIIVDVPYTEYQNLSYKEGIWELYIHPTANDVTDRPKRLIRGPWRYKPGLL